MNLITGAGSKSGAGKKKSQQGKVNRMQRPIICICNDLYAPSLRTLRQQALTVSQPHVVPQSRYAHRTQKSQKCPITGRKPVRVSFLEVWHPKIYIFGIRPLDNRTVNWNENIYLLVFNLSSRGCLVLELRTENSLPFATVGSNLRQVWCINLSGEETLCYNSNCRRPGPFRGL